MKILWVDTETTGLKPWEHGIIQLAGFVTKGGELSDEFNFNCAPLAQDVITPFACEVHGVAESVFREYPCPREVNSEFVSILDKHIDKYDRGDKFIIGGYNTRFDVDFLNHWFKKLGNPYFFSYAKGHTENIDVLKLWRAYAKAEGIKLTNNKLQTVAQHFDIEVDFHDAMGDIMATYMIYKILDGLGYGTLC